jgi:hypothetical protein
LLFFFSILSYLNSLEILTPIIEWLVSLLGSLYSALLTPLFGVPTWMTLVILGFIVYLSNQNKKINTVAGEFKDDFDKGLKNWDFGNEDWKIEQEDGLPLLSIANSREGGITKKGFSWSDYIFTFQTKVIRRNSSWIVRAENRNKFLMIQLNMETPNQHKLRLHLKVPGTKEPWYVVEEIDIEAQSFYKWITVKNVVLGNNVDVFLNNNHLAHFVIPYPIKIPTVELVKIKRGGASNIEDSEIHRNIAAMNYSVGKVGFRSSNNHEHAHFRKVRVKPASIK